jgi:hypothetical protein
LQVLSAAPSTVLDHKSFTPVLEHTGHVPRQPVVFFMPLPLFAFAILSSNFPRNQNSGLRIVYLFSVKYTFAKRFCQSEKMTPYIALLLLFTISKVY